MSLLGGIGASLRGAMTGVFGSGQLHRSTVTIDEYGAASTTSVDYDCEGFVAKWDSNVALTRGYAAHVAKILIVQADDMPAPRIGDEVTMARPLNPVSYRYQIVDVTSDPADATWQVAGVLVQ